LRALGHKDTRPTEAFDFIFDVGAVLRRHEQTFTEFEDHEVP
jgi:hypothetical protein